MLDRNHLMKLLQKAPRFRPEPLPSGISTSEIEQFIRRSGIRLPDDFRDYLLLSNGAWVGDGLFGVRPWDPVLDIESTIRLFPSWTSKGWIPIAADACGNYFVVPTKGDFGPCAPVLFINHETSYDLPRYVVASDVGHFLVFFLEEEMGEERWPFDAEYVIGRDPAILERTNVALPWDVDQLPTEPSEVLGRDRPAPG